MGELKESTLTKLKKEFALTPKEQLAEMGGKRKHLDIGIPKEISLQERRIPLTPNAVKSLTNLGHRIAIETGAGDASKFNNEEYAEAGADILYSREEIYKAEIILKATPPSLEDIGLMSLQQVILSPLFLPKLTDQQIRNMVEKRVTALAFEYIKDKNNSFPFIRSMSEIAGNQAILTAAKYLSNDYGKGILLGGITGQPPSKVLILGAGSVGEAAARAALGLGAQVQVFDDNIYRLQRIQQQLGQRIYTSVLDTYNLKKNLARAHAVIGAMHPVNGRTPCVVTEDMVAGMKEGAVIIDISIDHGGCFETSRVTDHKEPIFIRHGVTHYCVPNVASIVSRTASYALGNILAPMIRQISDNGGIDQHLRYHEGFRHGAYLYKGSITKEYIAHAFDMKFTDLELLLSANF